ALVAWGESWVRRVLVEGEVGRRRDEEIAAAALAGAAILGSGGFSEAERGAVRARLAHHVAGEARPRRPPFGAASFGAALLLGSASAHADDERTRAAIAAVVDAYEARLPTGAAAGVS